MHPDMRNGKILQILFSRRHKDRVFWASLVTHWKTLPPTERKKMLAGAACGLVVVIIVFILDIYLAAAFLRFISRVLGQ